MEIAAVSTGSNMATGRRRGDFDTAASRVPLRRPGRFSIDAKLMEIPFNRPFLVGNEAERIEEALGALSISEGGSYTERCERLIEDMTGVPGALLTPSCTNALEMAAILLNLQPGDEVIVPSFTFVSTANAFALRGARPVFADIRPDTLNLDEEHLESRISKRSKAIVMVHYGGVSCEADAICQLAAEHGIAVVEDNAHGFMGGYKGRILGTLGVLAAQSFHETKNITCGKGGALLINDARLIDRARKIRSKGTNRCQFLNGQVDKYSWVDLGSSYVPSDLLSAFLLCQLEALPTIQARRRALWERYASGLRSWAETEGVLTPSVPDHVEQTYHVFYLLLPGIKDQGRFISHMRGRGVSAVFHYSPLHSSPMGKRFGARFEDCPVAESVSQRIVRLPLFAGMSEVEQQRVIDAVGAFRCG
jgi:dTDP-4-amino-4,6-dideoxygalactose transaminase